MNLQDLLLPSYAQMLEALLGQLEKAKAGAEKDAAAIEDLMSARLAPDMFPLSSQLHFVCLQAEEAKARLLGDAIASVEPPQSFEDAKALISNTIERLRAAAATARDVDETRAIELVLSAEMTFDLDLAEYVRSWSIPQFYFHLITAYAIMRRHGVDLGKADYVPHMFAYLRKE